MKISELPPEIRELAEKNRAADTVEPGNKWDSLHAAFDWDKTPEKKDFWRIWWHAKTEAEALLAIASEQEEALAVLAALNRSEPVNPLATIPSPETLRPLMEAALAVMEPNDPAKAHMAATVAIHSDNGLPSYSVYFNVDQRYFYGHGNTPAAALEQFRENYRPPLTTETRIAAPRAELAKLEGSNS